MSNLRISRWSTAAVAVAMLSACATAPAPTPAPTPTPTADVKPAAPPLEPTVKDPPPPPPTPVKTPESELAAGITAYEDGNYGVARKRLEDAIAAGLAAKPDQVKAQKYLAFIFCAGNQVDKCRAAFVRAFQINPKFELTPSEAGHPIWGKVFKEVRAEHLKKGGKASKENK